MKRVMAIVTLFTLLLVPQTEVPAGQIPSHVYYALRYYAAMPEPLRGVIARNMNTFLAGAQGPDVAGVGSMIEGYLIRQEYGKEAHYAKTGMITTLLLVNSKTEEEFAYAVGWMTHYLNDRYVHAVVNSYGGYFLVDERHHKALEMIENKHVFSDPALSAVVSGADFRTVPDFLSREILQLVYGVFRDLFQGPYTNADAQVNFGYYMKLAGDFSRDASRNFLTAHQDGTGQFTDKNATITKKAFPPQMPSTEQYNRIMQGSITLESVKAEKEQVTVSLKVNDTRRFGRFTQDWNREAEIAATSYGSAWNDVNVLTQEMIINRTPYSASPGAKAAAQRLRATTLIDVSLDDVPHDRFGTSHPWPGATDDLTTLWYQGTLEITTDQNTRSITLDSTTPVALQNVVPGFEKSKSGSAEITIPVSNTDNDSYRIRARLSVFDPKKVDRPPLYDTFDYVDFAGNYTSSKPKPPPPPPPPKPDPPKPSVVAPPPQKMKLSYTLPGNWQGGLDKNGVLKLNRTPATMKMECGSPNVTANVVAELHTPLSGKMIKTAGEAQTAAEVSFKARRQGNTQNDMAVGLFLGGGIEGVSGISMGEYTGSIADFAIWVRRGSGSPWSGYSGSYMGANGSGTTVKENTGAVTFSYGVWGGGCWTNEDRAYLISQSAAAQLEAKAILASIRVTPDESVTRTEYTGPKYDGSDLPKVSLTPIPKEKLRIGQSLTVRAVVENAKPEDNPLAYNWGGTFDGKPDESKKSETVTIRPSKPGKYDLSVGVDGARFGMGGASFPYEVAEVKAKVERVPASAAPVPVGSKAGFKATMTSDGQPVSGNFVYHWQPHPEVPFDKLDAADPGVTATFPKPGKVKVWVAILEKRDGAMITVAESEQIEIDVIKPTLTLSVSPSAVLVGQPATARVTAQPDLKEIEYQWQALPGHAKEISRGADEKSLILMAREEQPIEIRVHARLRGTGEDLGEAKTTLQPKRYHVSVSGPHPTAVKPKIWKEGTGLVDLDGAFAVGQEATFTASVDGNPQGIRITWSVTSGPCTVKSAANKEVHVTADRTGTCQVAVVVKDQNDITLGTGGGTVTISVSQETLAQAQEKNKKVTESKGLIQGLDLKVRKGQLDDAITDAQKAVSLDPSNPEGPKWLQKLQGEKKEILARLERAKGLIAQSKFVEAQNDLIVAKNLVNLYPPTLAVDKELADTWRAYDSQMRDRLYAVRQAAEQKLWKKALEEAAAIRSSMKIYESNEATLRQQEDWAKQHLAEQDRRRQDLTAAGDRFKQNDFAGALKLFEQGFANSQNTWNGSEPEFQTAMKQRDEAFRKNKRLTELMPQIQHAAEDTTTSMSVSMLEGTLKMADEALTLQPSNPALQKYRQQIVTRIQTTTAEQARLDAGRKALEAARLTEANYNSQEAASRQSGGWNEQVEGRLQQMLAEAMGHYRDSLKHIPDPAIEKRIQALQTALDGRKKFLGTYQQSRALLAEGDRLSKEAYADPVYESGNPKFTAAIEKYRQSLQLYRPGNADMYERVMFNLDVEQHTRAYKKYWADGQKLEQAGRLVEALAAYEQSAAAVHPTQAQGGANWITVHIGEVRNKIAGAKQWRDQGDAQQKAGKIAEAIGSYRKSLALLPDKPLDDHVKILEASLAAGAHTAAKGNTLWQEGVTLSSQGRHTEALGKFKESLQYVSLPERVKYVQDLEARRAQAQTLRNEGSQFQRQNRLAEAVARYKGSVAAWPDPDLDKLVKQLEGALYGQRIPGGTPAPLAPASPPAPPAQKPPATPPPASTPTPSATAGTWTGTWKSEKRPDGDVIFVLTQNATRVTGTYTLDVMVTTEKGKEKWTLSGNIAATATGARLTGQFQDKDDNKPTGTVECALNPDGNSANVTVQSDGKSESWTARRIR